MKDPAVAVRQHPPVVVGNVAPERPTRLVPVALHVKRLRRAVAGRRPCESYRDRHDIGEPFVNAAARTPLNPVDTTAAALFWQAFATTSGLDSSVHYVEAFQFGDSFELANELAELVVSGRKRATCGTVAELDEANESPPRVGDYWIACDGAGRPVAVLRTTDVSVGPLSSVDDQFAWDEGEGDRSRAYWLAAHTDCFTRSLAEIGREFTPDIDVVFERFELLDARSRPALGAQWPRR